MIPYFTRNVKNRGGELFAFRMVLVVNFNDWQKNVCRFTAHRECAIMEKNKTGETVMAFFEMHYKSRALMKSVTLNVILPEEKKQASPAGTPAQ